MVSRQDATLNLASLIRQDLDLGGEVSDSGLLMPSEELLKADDLHLVQPLRWELTVRAAGGNDFLLTGSVAGATVQECRRCLTEVQTELHTDFFYPMSYRAGQKGLKLVETQDDDEDTLVFGQPEVDFAPLLAQLFAIEIPLTVLCKEACKGLAADGVNLNEHPEHVAHEETPKKDDSESPFKVLKDLDL
jgi:uncharacterized protein